MKHDTSGYRVTGRTAFGDQVKVFLQSANDPEEWRVLDLDGVVGYFDRAQQSVGLLAGRRLVITSRRSGSGQPVLGLPAAEFQR
jgi:hypothetical protein